MLVVGSVILNQHLQYVGRDHLVQLQVVLDLVKTELSVFVLVNDKTNREQDEQQLRDDEICGVEPAIILNRLFRKTL